MTGTDLRPSVRATYDGAETGPRYWVTTSIGGVTVGAFDDQTLIRGRTRHEAHRQAMHQHLGAFAREEDR